MNGIEIRLLIRLRLIFWAIAVGLTVWRIAPVGDPEWTASAIVVAAALGVTGTICNVADNHLTHVSADRRKLLQTIEKTGCDDFTCPARSLPSDGGPAPLRLLP